TCRVLASLEVIVVAGSRTDFLVFFSPAWVVVAQCDECCGPDGHGVGAQRKGFGNVGTGADTTGDDEFHLAVYAHLFERFHCWTDSRQSWNPNVFNEHFLGCSGSALHTVDDDDICTRCNSQVGVVVRTRCSHLDVDWDFPVGDFPQLLNLQRQVVWTGPAWVAARTPLVD